eukprot:CAMPEP_0113606578 /NCGR_PEP_ID=MMETSP0017_2-20120614/2930_1 /TAXON_ID=2856 /ORGANISM="Cylindrotheca closterium" /LENGTH=333 /DNA_ID=CAMNT_0000515133 /DNA_START=77 /DNA_END=1077 /DNA_ORIENTATION=- /assembly_acc=CAM_ASM_000147
MTLCQGPKPPAKKHDEKHDEYFPSRLENEVFRLSSSTLNYDVIGADECDLYHNSTRIDLYADYQLYISMMEKYSKAKINFEIDTDDIRLVPSHNHEEVCRLMDAVLKSSFHESAHLSLTRGGYVEPLLPPLRHPPLLPIKKMLLDIEYLVHDFGAICRQIESTARTVFFDLGASLIFHGGKRNPALSLLDLYRQFGIKFDHLYAFEYTEMSPLIVYDKIPQELLSSYHWYNVPVKSLPTSRQNPWTSILSSFNRQDFVVIKLDIDTPSVEIPLVQELLQEKYSSLVDHLYFEHHVKMKNMLKYWGDSANGTLMDSLELFARLRETGIAAHSWV